MTNRTAAVRYARALLDVAVQEHLDLAAIETELAGVVALFESEVTLRKVMTNPAVPAPRKRAAMAELVKQGQLTTPLQKLLVLLAERDRLVILHDLLAAYRSRLMDLQKVVRAEVTTAQPLAPERAEAIQQRLAAVTGRNVIMTTSTDPSLVGGMVARLGGTVFDGSVTTQLQKMKARLADCL